MPSNKSLPSRIHSTRNRFLICVLLLSLPFIFFSLSFNQNPHDPKPKPRPRPRPRPAWIDLIAQGRNKIKVGLVNMEGDVYDETELSVESVSIEFDRVDEKLKWEEVFPEWIDEKEAKCPHVPLMARFQNDGHFDAVVARVPCGARDVFRLQVNLVVANVAAKNRNVNAYVVFVGSCAPMVEIFRCDDLVMNGQGYWVYKPELRSLKHQTLMPVGSCQIAPQTEEEELIGKEEKVAYVTVLHSSEAYVCGAIALAQSIVQTKTTASQTIDLILLADSSIGPKSTTGLKSAGWKIHRMERIRSPFAENGAYNEWNYSKLRIWQLTSYDKIIFIDSDLVVLESIQHLFSYPQLSAAANDLTRFNSGVMVVEPSECMFEHLMNRTWEVPSYNGGDQGFLNEVFGWWHRLPKKVNHMKVFGAGRNESREVPGDVQAVHYLGWKPWTCYRDYDCNWDMPDRRIYASDDAHRRWWKVHDAMPKELQAYCQLTPKMNHRIVQLRRKASNNATFPRAHSNFQLKDPPSHNFPSDYS